jgi:two-component system, sensor histidine kinase LadS
MRHSARMNWTKKVNLVLRHFLLSCWLVCCALCAPQGAAAQKLGKLFDDSTTLKLAAPLQWQALPKGAVRNPNEFADAAKTPGFADLAPGAVLPTGPERDVWLRFALPTTAIPQTWYLRIPRMQLEQATLYFQNERSGWMTLTAGENIAVNRWPVPTRLPSFELTTRVDQSQTYYLKVEHRAPISERPELITPSEYINAASLVGGIVGLMLGLFGLLTALGLVSMRMNRNPHFAWFSVMVFSLLLTQLVLIGFAGLRLWPHSVYLNKVMGVVAPLWTLAAGTWFVVKVSYAKDAFARIYKISLVLIGLLLAGSLAFATMQNDLPRAGLTVLAAVAMLWNLGALVWMAWRSQAWLWFMVAGFAPLTLSMLARLSYNFGWIAHVEVAQLFSVITGCVGMMVVYAGLVVRNRESSAALERESALAHTDMSTGLSNARIAITRLPQVLARSARFEEPCGVIMLRWLDYNQHVNPLSSAQRGAVLSHFGARLRRLARNIDTVARMDDDHFVYLVESPVSREMLTALGSKIITTCLRPARALNDGDVYNVHLAVWTPTDKGISASEVMESLRTRLNQMGYGTQRKMQFVDSPLSSRPGDVPAEVDLVKRRQDIVAKINAIEASPILPTLAPVGGIGIISPPKSRG